ncbi:MAG: T9SS type A sorting domain-containing protein, partial [Bacteroidota bacterium]
SICFGNSITLTPSVNPSGTATYTITGGNFVVSPVSSNAYTVIATSSMGCISANQAVANVTVVTLPNVSALSGSVCLGLPFTPTVIGANTYTYSALLPLTPSVNTTYSVIGTNALTGCISNPASTFAVIVNARPSISITGNNTLCLGGITTLSASGAVTYSWSTTNGPSITVSPSVTTNYSVFGTSAAGCNSVAVMAVSVMPNPNINMTSGGICFGDSFTLSPIGASNYTFYPSGPIVTPTATSVYSVNGVNAFGCSMPVPATATITVGNSLTVTITGNTLVCSGETVNLTANGASTYSWNTGSNQNNISATPSINTSYSVLGSSGTCSTLAVMNVTVNPLPIINVSSSRTLICIGETVSLTASGANNYTWSVINQPTTSVLVVNPLVSTVYTITGLDNNNCSNVATFSQSVQNCDGLKENTSAITLNIYPNPSNGIFTIETQNPIIISVYNPIGELIYHDSAEAGDFKVNLNGKANGIYVIKVQDGSRVKFVKLIKE